MGALYRIYLRSVRWGKILLVVVLVFTPIAFVIVLLLNELGIPVSQLVSIAEAPITAAWKRASPVRDWLISNPVIIQAFGTLLLALLTYKSVQATRRTVDANYDHIKESRIDRRREYVRTIILDGLEDIKSSIRKQSLIFRSWSEFDELSEWEQEINEGLLTDIRRLSPREGLDVASHFREYRRLYKKYRTDRERLFSSMVFSLENNWRLNRRLNEIDWPITASRPSYKSDQPLTRAQRFEPDRDQYELTQQEAEAYLRDNAESITHSILDSHKRITQPHIQKLHDQVIDLFVEDEFESDIEKLRETMWELQSTRDELYQPYRSSGGGSIQRLRDYLQDEYDIYNFDLQSESSNDSNGQSDVIQVPKAYTGMVSDLSDRTVSIGSGTIYLINEEYMMETTEIGPDDYDTWEERDRMTPGTEYDCIRFIPGSWVEGIKEVPFTEEQTIQQADIYPVSRVDRIARTVDDQ